MTHASLTPAKRQAVIGVLALTLAACTMNSQEAPDLTGPSEFSQSIVVTASPDVLSQDGASQSVVTVTARGPNAEPLPNLSMNVEIRVNGVRADFGSLSARNIVTGSDGRATFVYTAPTSPALSLTEGTTVTIAVTPVGTDFGNSVARNTSIRVVPVGPVVPPDGLAPYFTMTPTQPLESQQVLFQACGDPARACAPEDNPIVDYDWDFGDGSGGNGQFETHVYTLAGSYTVVLAVSDQFGRSALAVQQITVGAGVNPTAAFVFSPASPQINKPIAFNASGSTAAAGRTIVSYTWDFGAGAGPQPGNATINHTYGAVGTYNVTLVVTDDAGKTGTVTISVTVAP